MGRCCRKALEKEGEDNERREILSLSFLRLNPTRAPLFPLCEPTRESQIGSHDYKGDAMSMSTSVPFPFSRRVSHFPCPPCAVREHIRAPPLKHLHFHRPRLRLHLPPPGSAVRAFLQSCLAHHLLLESTPSCAPSRDFTSTTLHLLLVPSATRALRPPLYVPPRPRESGIRNLESGLDRSATKQRQARTRLQPALRGIDRSTTS